jgi:hypothetical protein
MNEHQIVDIIRRTAESERSGLIDRLCKGDVRLQAAVERQLESPDVDATIGELHLEETAEASIDPDLTRDDIDLSRMKESEA